LSVVFDSRIGLSIDSANLSLITGRCSSVRVFHILYLIVFGKSVFSLGIINTPPFNIVSIKNRTILQSCSAGFLFVLGCFRKVCCFIKGKNFFLMYNRSVILKYKGLICHLNRGNINEKNRP
jgi:hypothetical protein